MLPAATPRCQALIDHAREAMRRLADVPVGADAARDAASQIELYWKHTPLTVAIAGPLALRAGVLNAIAGEGLFDPQRREVAGMVLTLTRGALLTCRARRRDGSVDELVLSEEVGAPAVTEETAADVAADEPVASPVVVPAAAALVVAAPRSLWRRLVEWLASLFGRRRMEVAPARVEVAVVPPPVRRRPPPPPPPSSARRRFILDLHALIDAATGGDIERVFLETDRGLLPRGVDAVDVPSSHGAQWLELADGCLLACEPGRDVSAADRALVQAARTRVPHVFAITLENGAAPPAPDPAVRHAGTCAEVLPRLPELLLTERALRLAAGAHAALRRTVPLLDEAIATAEADAIALQARVDALRIGEPEAFVAARVERLRGRVSERTHTLIRRATDAVLEVLRRREAIWRDTLSAAPTADELRAAIARIDEQWPAACADAVEDVRSLVRADLASAAPAILGPLLADIEGAPPPRHVSARPVEVPMTWATAAVGQRGELVGGAPRLASLLRSVETMKQDALERLAAGIAKARGRATADLLDAEPMLREAMQAPLAGVLEAALREHLERVATVLAREAEVLNGRLETVASLHKWRAVARDDELRLFDLVMLAEADLGLQLAGPAQ